jgi:type II secretory ATPase GspE/PulE/Tfp pilus assembly ATPase PilB-like protein
MPIKHADKILAQQCAAEGFLSQEQLKTVLQDADKKEIILKDYLLQSGLVSEDQLLLVFSKLYNLSIIDVSALNPDPELLKKIPIRFASYYKVLPVRLEGRMVELASSQPLDIKFQDEIRIHLGFEPKIVLAKATDILKAQNRVYGLAADMVARLSKAAPDDDAQRAMSDEIADIEPSSDEASVTRLVNEILLDAHQKRATDIHIEPYRSKLRVRYRIDGVLMDANIPDAARQFLPAIVSRIKIMSNLSIVEKRLPQDGSAVVKTKEQKLDLRVSAIPTPRGESMVIRILPTNVTMLGLEHLGLETSNLRLFRDLVKKPHGIILATGPTGSGKTTTLYACLNEINNPTRKIITLEDPVEYEMEGITQIQINPKIDFTFAAGLRSVLRHDPDIIMVGEIRDIETAEIAIRTALTGHMVFSTLHTNDAASGVTRLVEMGLEPFLVTSSIEAFVAQRLVRTICSKCKEEIKTPLLEIRKEIAESLGMEEQEVRMYRGRGCSHCSQTGFYGRTAIYEIMTFNEQLRLAVLERRNAEQIKQIAMKTGMITLRQDGWKKVVDGITTPEEVMNVTVRDHEIVFSANDTAEKGEPVPTGGDSVIEEQESVGRVRERVVLDKILETKNQYDSRVYTRFKIKTNIRYAVYHQDRLNPQKFRTNDIQHSSITKDISAGGVRFISGYALPVDTILDMMIQLPGGREGIHCLAKVCRVEDDAFSAMFHLVAFFLDISSADRSRLEEFVNQSLKEQS